MEKKCILLAIASAAQGVMGALAIVFAYVLYYNILNVQVLLMISMELMPLYMLTLFVLGFFWIISCFFLVREWREHR